MKKLLMRILIAIKVLLDGYFYAVEMWRYNDPGKHKYFLGVYPTLEIARAYGITEEIYRGNKYTANIWAGRLGDELWEIHVWPEDSDDELRDAHAWSENDDDTE